MSSFLKTIFQQQIRTYIYHPVYKGPFEYKKTETKMYKYPFGQTQQTLERKFEEIKEIRNKSLDEKDISPFHLVMRYKPFGGTLWHEKIILRRLGLHQHKCSFPAVIPNTPHYNKMLWEIKHLIILRPLKFPDGLPKESDIGSVKVDLNTGEMRISSAYRISEEQLKKSDLPPIFAGKYLREYLKWSSGLVGKGLPNHEVDHKDGNHIEEYDKKMKKYYNHQHVQYK